MGNVLVIPDVHGRSFWKEPIDDIISGKVNIDEIVFLGDFFDAYYTENISEYDAIINWFELLQMVKNNLSQMRYVFLLGNHDAHYANDIFAKNATGSRVSYHNFETLKGIFEDNRKLFRLAHEIKIDVTPPKSADEKYKKILFTHAGVNPNWYERHKKLLGYEVSAKSLNSLTESNEGWVALSEIGYSRGGRYNTGSLLWADVSDNFYKDENGNIVPDYIPGIDYQIFGHTQQKENPIINDKFAMLDCRKAFVLTDKLEINEYGEFKRMQENKS